MLRSEKRILTTHAGSLPRPADLLTAIEAREKGSAVDEKANAARVTAAVAEIVRKQVALGIDIVDDGEMGKPSFVSYVNERFGGCEPDPVPRGNPWAKSREARMGASGLKRVRFKIRINPHRINEGTVIYFM